MILYHSFWKKTTYKLFVNTSLYKGTEIRIVFVYAKEYFIHNTFLTQQTYPKWMKQETSETTKQMHNLY